MFNIELFLKEDKVYFLKDCLYHYVKNSFSATNNISYYKRNCCEFIENFFLTEEILLKYVNFTEDKKKKLATSRFNHLNSWYFNRMIKADLIDEIIDILTNNDLLLEMIQYVDTKNINMFRKIVCYLTKKRAKHLLIILFRFKRCLIKK